ncbi:MAG: hypothetical protein B7Z75_07545 [Acidocella sp. 20-57-95]|nr:MAG: hypothetical protein B7Z75_07545 [Acidocella sp. 20-57-95]OYV58811.1 MAG: hypothetical protein B7Z71_09345 [Acidocella sp. 21-58-7]HQT62935.1 tryptophan-rich sensory protein [Acidocella sp.]HQU04432.1 tryptophan-rich sensory protein [Acidocella sp.]
MGFLGLCLCVGGTAGWLTVGPALGWYASLTHPPLSPPNWLFGPVWTLLYAMMAVSAWMVWRDANRPRRRRAALTAWGVQLAFNASWTPVFFGLHLLLPGLLVILGLLAAVAATAWKFYRVDRAAGLLLLPYICWVSFATYLNAGFWWLNR